MNVAPLPTLPVAPAAPANAGAPGPVTAADGAAAPPFARLLQSAGEGTAPAETPSRPAPKGGRTARPALIGADATPPADTAPPAAPRKPATEAADATRPAEAAAPADDAEPSALPDAAALLAGLMLAPARPPVPPARAEARAELRLEARTEARAEARADTARPGVARPAPAAEAAAAFAVAEAAHATATVAEAARPPDALPPPLAPPAQAQAMPLPMPAADAPRTGADPRIAESVHSPGFPSALGAELSLLVQEGVHEARLQLNPAEMGPITVQIQIDGQNAQVVMAAEQALTRERLEQALPALAGALQDSGLTLTGGGVFQQPRQAQPQASAPGPRGGTAAGEPVPAEAAAPLRRSVAAGGVDLYA